MKNIGIEMTKTIKTDENGSFSLEDLIDLVDINKVKYYTVKHNKKENCITLKLYDKNKKLIRPYVKK